MHDFYRVLEFEGANGDFGDATDAHDGYGSVGWEWALSEIEANTPIYDAFLELRESEHPYMYGAFCSPKKGAGGWGGGREKETNWGGAAGHG